MYVSIYTSDWLRDTNPRAHPTTKIIRRMLCGIRKMWTSASMDVCVSEHLCMYFYFFVYVLLVFIYIFIYVCVELRLAVKFLHMKFQRLQLYD